MPMRYNKDTVVRTIYKYAIEITDRQEVSIPFGAKLLTVQFQARIPFLWAEVDTAMPVIPFSIAVYGTGNPCDGGRYISTAQQDGLVWHFYDVSKYRD